MRPLAFLAAAAAAALRPGARALTLGRPGDDPDKARRGAVAEACLAAAGLPECPPRGGAAADDTRMGAPPGCLDSALLAEDMGELGLGAEGCASIAARRGTGAQDDPNNPLAWTPKAGQVPRANVSHTKPVIWVHVHKSMGTFIYFLSHISGENVVQPSFNGNWWPYDTPDAVIRGKAWHANCSSRSEWFDWSNATWGQIEHEMEDYNLCHEHFNYGTLLRDPNQLAISKASMEGYSPDETIASLSCLVRGENDDVTNLAHACKGRKLWKFWDNFLTRTLAGVEVSRLPAGAITEEHVHKAIQRLSKFEVVMFAEDLEDREHLERAIGWRPESYEKVWTRPSTHVVELTDEQDAQARHTNRFDYMVHEHFRSMSMRERVKKFQ